MPANITGPSPATNSEDKAGIAEGFTDVRLTGITWNHSRGYLPMVATAQRFAEMHPGIEIVWQKRSLQEFADSPIQLLAQRFDLLVIDHPFVGYAAAHPTLLALDEHLDADFLAEQAAGAVGASHRSYYYGGHQWALAIDAATPVASWRPDLLQKLACPVPRTWDEILALARRGAVAVPALAVDSLMNFFMLCVALGAPPNDCDPENPEARGMGERANRPTFYPPLLDESVAVAALQLLRELVALCPPNCLTTNPIALYEAMASGEKNAYCPFAYGYSNYARPGYAPNLLRFGTPPQLNGVALRSTLGGTGLAIGQCCRHPKAALAYARFVASPQTQRTLYTQCGGQPGHRSAWSDASNNEQCAGFFADTLPALDGAWLRPRYNGYLHFQDEAGPLIHAYLREGGEARRVVAALEALYQTSRSGA